MPSGRIQSGCCASRSDEAEPLDQRDRAHDGLNRLESTGGAAAQVLQINPIRRASIPRRWGTRCRRRRSRRCHAVRQYPRTRLATAHVIRGCRSRTAIRTPSVTARPRCRSGRRNHGCSTACRRMNPCRRLGSGCSRCRHRHPLKRGQSCGLRYFLSPAPTVRERCRIEFAVLGCSAMQPVPRRSLTAVFNVGRDGGTRYRIMTGATIRVCAPYM